MINVEFNYKGYKFSNVVEKDLHDLIDWIKENNDQDKSCLSLDEQLFYRRYLEYFFSKEECFIKVTDVNDKIIAIFKGRIEEEKKSELFIWLFVISKKIRNEGIGTEIIDIIIKYFKDNYSVKNVEAGVVGNNMEGISFWNSLGFDVKRVSTKFFTGEKGKGQNLVVMKR